MFISNDYIINNWIVTSFLFHIILYIFMFFYRVIESKMSNIFLKIFPRKFVTTYSAHIETSFDILFTLTDGTNERVAIKCEGHSIVGRIPIEYFSIILWSLNRLKHILYVVVVVVINVDNMHLVLSKDMNILYPEKNTFF